MAAATTYKLLTRAEWNRAQEEGVYRGSAHDRRDGFIHFSTAAQLQDTARKYFSGVPDLVLLAVDTEVLESRPSPQPSPQGETEFGRPFSLGGEGQDEGICLRWEPSRGGDLFPHLYADLPLAAVRSVTAIEPSGDGTPIIPAGLAP
jgi:uncharacterized protein (DUF952 family)